MEHVWSIDKLLKNVLVLKSGTSKNPTTALYSKTTKPENFFDEKKTIKNVKIAKQSHAFKGYTTTCNVDILKSFNPELQLEDAESEFTSCISSSSKNQKR